MSLMDTNLEKLQAGSHYHFSATKIQHLGAAEYTLASIVMDTSGSVSMFQAQLETALKTVFKACEKSPRKDNLLMRLTAFDSNLREIHGFKLLSTIQESDYNGVLSCGGSTALFESVDEAIQATSAYGKQLTAGDFLVNAIVVIVTDGENNAGSISDPAAVLRSVEYARKSENLESITLILVGVTGNDISLDGYLKDFADKAGITQYVSIGTATPGKIAKLADFVSQSISSTSASLGTGQPSKPVTSFKF